jgi:hypothetical protein
MTENQDNPGENLPGKAPEQHPQTNTPSVSDSFPPTSATASLTNQPNQEMEVHHHGHVPEHKKWKEYIFQFVMLFLAVFLGFWSENLRENRVEKNMEAEYIESLMKEVTNDSSISEGLASDIFTQIKGIDSLQTLLSDLDSWPKYQRDSIVRQCYKFSKYILTFYPIFFNESTITQLLSSGNMRIIKKQGVADVIMGYHGNIKFVEVQKQLYVNSANTCIQSMYNIYDVSFSKSFMRNDSLLSLLIDSIPDLNLLPTSAAELKKFTATLEITKLVASTYRNYLLDMKNRAEELYSYLAEKYNIKEK